MIYIYKNYLCKKIRKVRIHRYDTCMILICTCSKFSNFKKKKMSSKSESKNEGSENEYYYDEEEGEEEIDEYDDDGIEAPNFLVPSNLQEDEEEINYYAKKLGIDPEVEEWDDYLIENGYAKILEGITAGRPKQKQKVQELVKAVRTPEEESARKDFTGLLNRIAPSNFNHIAAQIRDAYSSHPPEVSLAQFTRCITQRLYSDAILPDMFIDVYSRALKEVPDAIQNVVDTLQNSNKKDTKNVRNFIQALGEDIVTFYSSNHGNSGKTTVDEEVSKLTQLARKLHMTTDVRRGVFFALMTAVDVSDCVAKISKLHLSKTMKRDVPIVIMECCRNENKYNPYYAAVTELLAKDDKVFQHNLVSAIKNSIQLAADFTVPQLSNSGKFLSQLVCNGVIDLGFLRGTHLNKLGPKPMTMLLVFFAEFFKDAELGIIDDEVTKLENAPNFGADVGKFLARRGIKHAEGKKGFPPDRLELLKSTVSKLNRPQI